MKAQLPDNYKLILKELKQLIAQSQVKTVIAANKQMLWLYWRIGNEIIQQQERQGWGSKVISRLSADLRSEFPKIKGFSFRNISYMKQFASRYSKQVILIYKKLWNDVIENPEKIIKKIKTIDNEMVTILQQPVAILEQTESISQQAAARLDENDFLDSPIASITWSHHLILIDKVKKYPENFWYILNTIEHGISRNILSIQIESGLYQRQIEKKKISNFKKTLPEPQSDFANYLLKDPYIFDFVQAKESTDERDIEEQLSTHVTKFLLELGEGFAFIDRQYHLKVSDKDFFIDLLFYHTKLHCYVVVELKAGKFEPGQLGALGFYVAAIDGEVKSEKDNPTIGLLLCKEKNEVVAEYSLKGYKSPIAISEYTLSEMIPEEIKSRLPSIEEIEEKMLELK